MDPAEELIKNGEYGEQGFYVYKAASLAAERFRLFTKKVQADTDRWTLADTLNLASELLLSPARFSPGVRALEVAFNSILDEQPELKGYEKVRLFEQLFGRRLGRYAITEAEDRELREKLMRKRGGSAEPRPVDGEFRAPTKTGERA